MKFILMIFSNQLRFSSAVEFVCALTSDLMENFCVHVYVKLCVYCVSVKNGKTKKKKRKWPPRHSTEWILCDCKIEGTHA